MIYWKATNREPIVVTSDEAVFTALPGVNCFPGYIWCWLISHKMMSHVSQSSTPDVLVNLNPLRDNVMEGS